SPPNLCCGRSGSCWTLLNTAKVPFTCTMGAVVMPTRTITNIDRDLLDELASAGRLYVQLPEDDGRVRKHLTSNERPARRLSDMAARQQVVRVARGAYVLLPAGARSLRQAADRRGGAAAPLPERPGRS